MRRGVVPVPHCCGDARLHAPRVGRLSRPGHVRSSRAHQAGSPARGLGSLSLCRFSRAGRPDILPRTLRFHPPEAVRRDTLRPATGVGRSNAPSRQSRLACSPGPLSAGPHVQQDFVPDAGVATPAVALTSWVSDVSWTSLRQRVCIIAQAREGVDWCCRPSYRRGCGKHCGAACWGTAIQQRRRKTLWGCGWRL